MLQLRQSKIEYFRIATGSDKDVSEFDITMYDPSCMGRSKSVRDLNAPFHQIRQRDGTVAADQAQVAPFKQLHDNEWCVLIVVLTQLFYFQPDLNCSHQRAILAPTFWRCAATFWTCPGQRSFEKMTDRPSWLLSN